MSFDGERSNFDTERFIKEVYSRIALWDTTTEEYSNRDLKKISWDELVDIFINKEVTSAAEKNEYSRILQRKWKSLRDCFSRERQRLAKSKSGSAASRKTQYVFYKQLCFLHKVIKSKDSSTINMEETAVDEFPSGSEEAITCSPVPSVEHKQKRKILEGTSPDVEHLVNVLQTGIQTLEEREQSKEDDSDRLFLLSLLNPMKRIPDHLRFSVRIQMMQVIENASTRDYDSG